MVSKRRSVRGLASQLQGTNVHLIGAISSEGMEHIQVRRGSYRWESANELILELARFIEARGLDIGRVVLICDNAPCHARLERAVEQVPGLELLRLSPYSPMLYPKHTQSIVHAIALNAIANLKGQSIVEKIDTGHKQQMVANRVALQKIFSTINLLGQQGLPLRGSSSDENSNFLKFIQTRAEGVVELKQWLSSDGKRKWLGHDIQNEILGLLANKILQQLITEIRQCDYFSI